MHIFIDLIEFIDEKYVTDCIIFQTLKNQSRTTNTKLRNATIRALDTNTFCINKASHRPRSSKILSGKHAVTVRSILSF